MTDIKALIERLEAADGPDMALDADICVAAQYGGKSSVGATNVRTDPDREGDLLFEVGAEECCNPIPALTASLDAAVAFKEQVLPGWIIASIGQQDDRSWAAELRKGFRTSYTHVATSGGLRRCKPPNGAIALLIATLRALQATRGGDR